MMRDALIQQLSEASLNSSLGGNSLTWGQLINDRAQAQRFYLDAFSTLDQRWPLARSAREHLTTVAEILELFHAFDRELAVVLEAFSGDDWDAVIVRPDDTKRTRRGQFEIYAQFMLIFLGKASVYARLQHRDIPLSVLGCVD